MFKPFYITIAKYAAAITGVVLLYLGIRQSGKNAVKNEAIKETLERVKTRDKVQDAIINADDDERKRLRKKYTRK